MAGWPGRGKPRPYIPYLDSAAMLPRERLLRHERSATHAPLRVDDCQFAIGFESANLRKNRRPPRRRCALRLLVFLSRLLRMTCALTLEAGQDPTRVEIRCQGDTFLSMRTLDH
jgi:hypothetical protein